MSVMGVEVLVGNIIVIAMIILAVWLKFDSFQQGANSLEMLSEAVGHSGPNLVISILFCT